MMKRYLLLFFCFVYFAAVWAESLKVLAIGNSFSVDAVEKYLYQLAAEQGDTLLIGNAVIGGCDIDKHLANLKSEKRDYRYRKIVQGELVEKQGLSLSRIIQDEDWDIITLQQVSFWAGLTTSYGNLPELKKLVIKTATNPKVEIIWHMTWAYPRASKYQGFKHYGYDQQVMYDSIVSATEQVLPRVGIERYIPTGIALQKAREELGDIFNRDGLHLNMSLGRYVAGCVWCEFLTGKDIIQNPWWPEDISGYDMRKIKRVVHSTITEMLNPQLVASDKTSTDSLLLSPDAIIADSVQQSLNSKK